MRRHPTAAPSGLGARPDWDPNGMGGRGSRRYWAGGSAPGLGGPSRPPPLPTWCRPDRVLGMFRPDWCCRAATSRRSTTAMSGRGAGSNSSAEARPWLGSEWGRGRERLRRPGVAAPAVAIGHQRRGRPDRVELSREWRAGHSIRTVIARAAAGAVLDPGRRARVALGRGADVAADDAGDRRGPPAQGFPRIGIIRAGPSRRRAGPADRPALPALSHRTRVLSRRESRAHPEPGARRTSVLAPPARLLGRRPIAQDPELAGAHRLRTFTARPARPCLRRACELGARRDLRHLSPPRSPRPAAPQLPGTPGPRRRSSSPNSPRTATSSRFSPWNDRRAEEADGGFRIADSEVRMGRLRIEDHECED